MPQPSEGRDESEFESLENRAASLRRNLRWEPQQLGEIHDLYAKYVKLGRPFPTDLEEHGLWLILKFLQPDDVNSANRLVTVLHAQGKPVAEELRALAAGTPQISGDSAQETDGSSRLPGGSLTEGSTERRGVHARGPTRPARLAISSTVSPTVVALEDLLGGARAWYLWGHLGWYDIRQQYRRSTIGPLWITISMGVLIGSLGYLYTHLFQQDVSDYLPFIAAGFILWGLLAGMINEGASVFIGAGQTIKQVRIPLSVHVFRIVWKNVLIFFHNVWIFVLVMVLFRRSPGWLWPLAVPGLVLIAVNGLWLAFLLGTVSARFRDIPSIIASVVQIAFFLTPVMWKPDMRPDLVFFVGLNPFHHLMHVVRAPLLGQAPALHNWLAALGITVAGWITAFVVYRRFRGRIAYWV